MGGDMKLGSRRMILPLMETAVVCLLSVAPASGQAAPAKFAKPAAPAAPPRKPATQ